MKQTYRSAREVAALLTAICALAIMAVTLATMAVSAENPIPTQTPAAAQSPSATAPAPSTPTPSPTPTPINWSSDPMVKRFIFRGIGPASMGGRIDDITCVENNSYICYVAFATGGSWKTTNYGPTFEPVFATYRSGSVVAVAMPPSH